MNDSWLNEKYERIEELTTDFSISKYNLFKISFLKRLLEESLIHSESCSDCKKHLPGLETMIEKIPDLEKLEVRSPYEKRFNEIRTHFHKKHGFIQPYHFSTLWTLAGTGMGILLSVVGTYLVKGEVLFDPVLAFSALGLTVGYLVGSTIEGKYRRAKKII